MRPPPVPALVLGLVLAAGCKPAPHRPDAAPPWWKPMPGEIGDWDIQLTATATAPFNISAPRAMYTLDLWDVVPAATMLDYGDGAPLAVPAGALPNALAELHARTPPAIVVCHMGAGSIRLDDPDAKKFPGYEANPPNRPNPPASGSVIGWSTTLGDASERFIDIHAGAARNIIAPRIGKRIELAKTIGCDAIAVKDLDLPRYESDMTLGHGFAPISLGEFTSWSDELSTRAHDLTLSIGPRDQTDLGADSLSLDYDWTMLERCAEIDGRECPAARPFRNKAKAVFAIEYDLDASGMPNDTALLCNDLLSAGIRDGIIKTAALASAPPVVRCP